MSKTYHVVARWVVASLAIAVLIGTVLVVGVKNTVSDELRTIDNYRPWSKETIKLAETLPVQNGGRIKPLSAHSGFSMLGLHGARSMEIIGADGKKHKLTPTEWMLDSVFRPDIAVKLPTFRIDNSEVLANAGIKVGGRRDRYSYTDIEPGRDKLIELAKSFENIKEADRDPVQQQTIDLGYNIRNYESLLGYFGFARNGVTLAGTGNATTPDQRADISSVMTTAPQIRAEIARAQAERQEINPRIKNLLEQVIDGANFSKFGLFILPPVDKKDTTWQSAGNTIMAAMTQEAKDPAIAVSDIKLLEGAARAVGDDDLEFRKAFTKFHDAMVQRAELRGEYDGIELEARYYRANWFLNAMVVFLLGSLTALVMWAVGHGLAGKIFAGLTWTFTSVGFVLCLIAMVQRSLIMQRPPVGNLYDTIIFICTTMVLLSMVVEWMTKRRFALGIGPILGVTLIVLSRRFELGDAKDHMDPLVAVLDSNYWLTTHVITITLGYSAGLLAAFLAGGYLLLRGLALDGENKDLRRSLTRAVYGMLCLTLFLSLIGTVLGGIWANYSWGRFWGWDPKENGALMIVIWTLVVLHARLGGYIKEWGLHMAAVFTACVVVFSWWHVNFLGVGLHNYGFTSGKGTIWLFYSVIALFMAFGFVALLIEKWMKAQAREEKAKLLKGRA